MEDGPPVPQRVFDQARLAAVEASGLVGSAPEEAFDRLAERASELLGAPFAFVTAVDTERSWYKSFVGAPPGAPRWVPVEESFCQYVIGSDAECFFSDAREDSQTRDNPSVHKMGVVAWAGFPVRTRDGDVLGTFCVVDTKPRQWTEREHRILETLAGAASAEVSLRDALEKEQAQRCRAEAAAQKLEQINAELAQTATHAEKLATTLSQSLLPPRLEAPRGLDVGAAFLAANRQSVTGDFYDLFQVDTDTWAVVIGDVMGKGPAAATLATEVRYTVRAESAHDTRPAQVLAAVSRLIHAGGNSDERFATAAYALLRQAGQGQWAVDLALAGHPQPLVRRADGEVAAVGSPGRPLGMFPDPNLCETRLLLDAGDRLVLYTDGVVEARNAGEEFGSERLTEIVAGASGTAHDLAQRVLDASVGFAGEDRRDDLATIAVLANPSEVSAANGSG